MQQPIAKNAITMLINLSEDSEVIEYLTTDEKVVEVILAKLTVGVKFQYHIMVSNTNRRPKKSQPLTS